MDFQRTKPSTTKDLPIPQVLTTEVGEIMTANKDDETVPRNIAIPTRRSSLTNLAVQRQDIEPSPQTMRVCPDSRLHPPGIYVQFPHRGLVEGTDFCDAGLAGLGHDSPIRSTTTYASTGLGGDIMTGRIRRVLTGSDLCEEVVDVSQHIHRNHPSSVKTGPALGLVCGEERHDVRASVSKVRLAEVESIQRAIPYSRISESRAEQEPISKLALWNEDEEFEGTPESPETASYWEFIPTPRDVKEENVWFVQDMDTRASLRSRQPSVSTKSTESPRTVYPVSARPPSSAARQEGVVLFNMNAHQEETRASILPTSRLFSSEDQGQPPRERALSGKLDLRRAAEWLREVLGLRGSECPKLTGLPEKPQPQLEARSDYRGDRPSAVRRKLTTSSSDRAAYAGAINAAVDSLERMSSEALQFADDAITLGSRGHADDDSLRAPLGDVSGGASQPLYPESIRESIRSSLGEICTWSLDGGPSDEVLDFSTQYTSGDRGDTASGFRATPGNYAQYVSTRGTGVTREQEPPKGTHDLRDISLRNRSHISLAEGAKFSLTSTASIGMLVGIYAGLVPSIQYYIVDFHHHVILGNVALFAGMALPTFFCWPLPLLHGRKPYIICSLTVSLPLLFPQAVAVSTLRSPYTSAWRWALLLPRGLMGFALGFASMNFHSILTDVFGASLMSGNPHQEVVDKYDVRRHGGGLGVWLGIWTWCWIGSLSVGFLIGAAVIDMLLPSWGLYISIILIGVVLLLNVLSPEVRGAFWRRSATEVRKGTTVSRRIARGEIMMHRAKDGPRWWGQEVYHGVALCLEMLRQPGFAIMAVYSAWIYAQVVLIITLLGSLTSRFYRYRSPYVGAAVASVAIGALAAVPFQMANIFSRARYKPQRTNSMTFDSAVTWTSHFVRRVIFVLVLPIAGILYTIVSVGPRLHVVLPCLFAAMIGFLSCLAISECNGLLMETWDISDLQPGMTGRPRMDSEIRKKTNYSSFPRVTAGFAVIHTLAFIFAAGATALGGMVQRRLGQMLATGAVAAILLGLSILLLAAMIRFRKVEIIPKSKTGEMNRWNKERRDSATRRASMIAEFKASGRKDLSSIPEDDVGWRPLVLGNPSSTHRRINVLELGSLTRWTEIRKRNHLIDQGAHAHLNREAVMLAREELGKRGTELMSDMQRGKKRVGKLARKVSKRSLRGKRGYDSDLLTPGFELQNLSSPGPSGGGVAHRHAPFPGENPADECAVGQAVPKDDGDVVSVDDESPLGTELVVDFGDVELEDRTTPPRPKLQKKQD
ncbi:hypothetical protein DL766_008297 [Monosporascus sp. MC13-8B]|uniref:Major facilitator superfamily (MFS) profile domain-containing protein n=1 Tax=Monosporascus cannonballus TaxID=155416 RepID=A0ABY0GYS6_9PEZI|nr:hypothetical protein DL762_007564 [Monosporascus cannonballus]RYP20022.1 hypothetical protein DL766_008297 [Monosporascus sp. MC13-8B]